MQIARSTQEANNNVFTNVFLSPSRPLNVGCIANQLAQQLLSHVETTHAQYHTTDDYYL